MNNPKPKPGTDAKSAIQATNIFKELHGHFIEDLEVGMTDFYSRTITEADIVMFAGITGDMNPVHMNREFAEQTQFGGPIAHGMLTASLISTVVGTKLPGPGAIYMSQNIRFTAPVRAGDTITAVATVTDVNVEKRRCALETICVRGDEVVVKGDALLLVPTRKTFENSGD
ncbi:MAG: MaoC family dehydratase [Rhodospirillaceae bacterium]|jgi:3-hydroxybutyryl-CoA dehydratase|nr:MaoC family dehydratase [Rhodospirillaceae bacterium]MBT4045939.1 MaoC family dehydratase [Rhodospirillaceae bacterium]MBT4687136.1 MaoC family dehydratase [Rhodospirillaceae bacterium]MBT5081326.1 MaoC family dehydratase [Rhodospirillaceae bacterium]MBT5522810.1 MaoC family dehydratase [Rhodospirillaceae bacterium]